LKRALKSAFHPFQTLVRHPKEPRMPKKNDDNPKSVRKQAWPILAIGITVAGLLTWLGWTVTRPDV